MDRTAQLFLPLEQAADVHRTGGKAAMLAQALSGGLDVPPGVVAPVEATRGEPAAVRKRLAPHLDDVLAEVGGAEKTVVVRSSSPAEDRPDQSLAGRFASVGDVRSVDELADAVEEVVRSRDRVGRELDTSLDIAVVVQRQIEAACGGVMFTVDPTTSDPSRIVVSAAREGPAALVSGEVSGTTHAIDRSGRLLERDGDDSPLGEEQLRRLAHLARDVEELFGAPQDTEWAIDDDGRLWLLQSRPITVVRDLPLRPDGQQDPDLPILGPGPVAETYPVALHALERDLWVPPLHEALREVFRIVGSASPEDLDSSPIVTTVEGHVVADLDLFGMAERERPWWAALDPRPRLRRLASAWRVGRLRGSLLPVAQAVVDHTDQRLAEVPGLDELSDRQLSGLLERGHELLRALHAHEVLVGLLVDEETPGLTGASVALRVLATARRDGWEDRETVRRHPIVLAVAPPRIVPTPELPATPEDLPPRPITSEDANEIMVLREALRIRVRWVQELEVRAVLEVGHRLTEASLLDDPMQVRVLRLDELRAALEGRAVTSDLDNGDRRPSGAPVPAAFQLQGGRVVPVSASDQPGGTGAGGGRGAGPACVEGEPDPGDVLVVRTLDPALGPRVRDLGGLVAETGSVLSHVAILAREAGVPTVVGVAEATSAFADGDELVVDGDNGTVERKDG